MDHLHEFARAFLDRNPVSANMFFDGPTSKIAEVEASLLLRMGAFQVQLFSVPANYIIPAHTHPNVDSFEVYIDGSVKFSHRGRFVFDAVETIISEDYTSYSWRMLRVKPADRHGAVVGSRGARFLSIQQWLNGVAPDCVACDYTGPVMDVSHLRLVKAGAPEARNQSELVEWEAL